MLVCVKYTLDRVTQVEQVQTRAAMQPLQTDKYKGRTAFHSGKLRRQSGKRCWNALFKTFKTFSPGIDARLLL